MIPSLYEDEKKLILSTWEAMGENKIQVGIYHYKTLFEKHPDLKKLFKTPIEIQANRLMESLRLAVENLNNLRLMENYLLKLGLKHKGYKVKKKHYPIINDSILAGLHHVLGQKWTEEVEEAWVKLLEIMGDIMIEGSKMKYIPPN